MKPNKMTKKKNKENQLLPQNLTMLGKKKTSNIYRLYCKNESHTYSSIPSIKFCFNIIFIF